MFTDHAISILVITFSSWTTLFKSSMMKSLLFKLIFRFEVIFFKCRDFVYDFDASMFSFQSWSHQSSVHDAQTQILITRFSHSFSLFFSFFVRFLTICSIRFLNLLADASYFESNISCAFKNIAKAFLCTDISILWSSDTSFLVINLAKCLWALNFKSSLARESEASLKMSKNVKIFVDLMSKLHIFSNICRRRLVFLKLQVTSAEEELLLLTSHSFTTQSNSQYRRL